MLTLLKISKGEYVSILRNRGKYVSPSISYDKLINKVKDLKKKDLKHLLSIRNIETNDNDTVDDIINKLFKDIHKKKQAEVIDDLYRHHHKKMLPLLRELLVYKIDENQKKVIANKLKELKLFDYTKKGYISNKDIEVINRLSKLSRDTLTKLAQLRNINVTKLQEDNVIRRLKESDLIYILLKSKKDPKEKKLLRVIK